MITIWHWITFGIFRSPTRLEFYQQQQERITDRLLEVELERISLEAEYEGYTKRIRYLNTGNEDKLIQERGE